MKTAPSQSFVSDQAVVANGRLASAVSPLPGEGNTRRLGRSSPISHFPKLRLPALPPDPARVYMRLFSAAFPARSRRAMCMAAAHQLGCSPDTVENIITGSVHKVDFPLILMVAMILEHRTGEHFEFFEGHAVRVVAK